MIGRIDGEDEREDGEGVGAMRGCEWVVIFRCVCMCVCMCVCVCVCVLLLLPPDDEIDPHKH